jgi:hypothetical protein
MGVERLSILTRFMKDAFFCFYGSGSNLFTAPQRHKVHKESTKKSAENGFAFVFPLCTLYLCGKNFSSIILLR